MKRAPRTALEAKFVANLQTLLPILLGEPEQDDGREYVFHDAVGKVAITYSLDDPTAPASSSGGTTASAAPVSTCSSSST